MQKNGASENDLAVIVGLSFMTLHSVSLALLLFLLSQTLQLYHLALDQDLLRM